MDYSRRLKYLRKRQEEELEVLNENIEQLESFKQDYQDLCDRVAALPDKTNHEVMISVAGSKLAFMAGCLKHTNEYMVLSGEDYFIELSGKQTVEFINHRMAYCQDKIKDLQDNKRLLADWVKVSAEVNKEMDPEGAEFVHEETEEEYQEWKKKHDALLEKNTRKVW